MVTSGRPGAPLGPDLAAARVLVAGLGVTGRAVVAALVNRAAAVTTLDANAPGADLQDSADVDLTSVDLVVASPGWAPTHPLLVASAAAGIPVWSEVELAWRLRVDRAAGGGPAPWLAVTGTNGKTTTVGMLTSMLEAAGLEVAEVGNVGRPVVEAVVDPSVDVLAVELSSFQLHFTHTMAVEAGAVLNVATDHVDWHGSAEAYAADKGRIFEGARVACVYNVADATTRRLVEDADVADGARAVGFTLGSPGRAEIGLIEDIAVDRAFHTHASDPGRHSSAEEIFTLADLEHLAGPDGRVAPHVVANVLAAAALARAHGLSADDVRRGARAFRPGQHRIETIATASVPGGSVSFVDDSKATNAHAASASLAAFAPGSVVWVAGGLAKGARFDDLVIERRDRLRAVVLIGVDAGPLAEAIDRHAPDLPVVRVDPGETGTVMARAVAAAAGLAKPGDTVLLAPASASMDQFRSYAERGEMFAAAAREHSHDGE